MNLKRLRWNAFDALCAPAHPRFSYKVQTFKYKRHKNTKETAKKSTAYIRTKKLRKIQSSTDTERKKDEGVEKVELFQSECTCSPSQLR